MIAKNELMTPKISCPKLVDPRIFRKFNPPRSEWEMRQNYENALEI